jgi:hypothetical protein
MVDDNASELADNGNLNDQDKPDPSPPESVQNLHGSHPA